MVKKCVDKLKRLITEGFLPLFKGVEWTKISVSTYVRWILAILLSVNNILTFAGLNPIPISENLIYEIVSMILNVVVLISNTYKNNSTSKEAIIADKVLKALKAASLSNEETAIGKIMDILKELNGDEFVEDHTKEESLEEKSDTEKNTEESSEKEKEEEKPLIV